MKKLKQLFSIRILILLIGLIFTAGLAKGQSASAEELINEIQDLLVENYVFLDKAQEMSQHLLKLQKKKYFQKYDSNESLAEAITTAMREITNDRHLRLRPPLNVSNDNRTSDESVDVVAFTNRYYRPAVRELKYLENNVAYVDIGYFGGNDDFYSSIDALMSHLKLADAIIIDMRTSHGGSPSGVQYFCSYFFDEPLLLNTIYRRYDDNMEEFWVKEVDGKKRPDVPLYILTSSRTFSAAEDFPYTLQSRKRATIIGEVTRGGAHPTRGFSMVGGFRLGIPIARSINPITGTNWEGTGIQPDVELAKEQAYEKAIELANSGAEQYKKELFNSINAVLNSYVEAPNESELHYRLGTLIDKGLLTESNINRLGYRYLSADQATLALALFKANTQLFRRSANTYDSYAEGLAMSNNKELALINYQLAVEVAIEHGDARLENFREHLENFKKTID